MMITTVRRAPPDRLPPLVKLNEPRWPDCAAPPLPGGGGDGGSGRTAAARGKVSNERLLLF